MKLWERLLGDGKAGTLKPTKKHGTIKRSTLSRLAKNKTLGTEKMSEAVKLPEGENKNDWLATNVVDFFNELSLLLGLVMQKLSVEYASPGEGFPPGVEYFWAQPGKKQPLKVSGPEYCDLVMTWVEDQLDSSTIFPVLETDPWPDDFVDYVQDIVRRMFRVYAIIYFKGFKEIQALEATAHLQTAFKHFMFFLGSNSTCSTQKRLRC